MFGFGAFGNFSYPTRRALGGSAPDSREVDYLPDNWMDDWQRRYNEEEARRGQGATSSQWVDGSTFSGGPLAFAQLVSNPDTVIRHNPNFNPDTPGSWMTQAYIPGSGGYVPNFEALNAERDLFKAASENQKRQQQAYNSMIMGNGQIGGVMTNAYSSPSFGQISGNLEEDSDGMSPPAMSSPAMTQPGMTQPGTLGGFGSLGGNSDLTGIAADNQSGAYVPGSGFYNPSPFGLNAFRRNPSWWESN